MSLKVEQDIRKASAFITTDGGDGGSDGGSDGGAGGADGGDGGSDGGAGSGDADDLAALFSPEEVTAKKEALAAATAEESRRAALSDEERKAEDDARAADDALKVVPEKYEFKLPEGYKVDEELMGEVSKFAKATKLTIAEAQKVADMGAKLLQKQEEQRHATFENIKKDWLATAQKDKEIGADVQAGKDSKAARAFNTIATPEMKAMVDAYGIGNHPEMLRMFYRLSTLMSEDGLAMPGTGAGLKQGTGLKETVGSIFNHPDRKLT